MTARRRPRQNRRNTSIATARNSSLDNLRKHDRTPESEAEQSLYKSARWKLVRDQVIRRDAGLCAYCLAGGANSADHVLSRSERPDLDFYDRANLVACHAWPKASPLSPAGQPIFCNAVKGAMSAERAQRLIAERIGSYVPPPDDEPEVKLVEGREWL